MQWPAAMTSRSKSRNAATVCTDDVFVDAAEMQAAQHAVQLDVGEARPRVGEHVDHAGVAARREHDQALAGDVHRDVALVHQELIEFPAFAVRGAAMLTRQAHLEAADSSGSRRSRTPCRRRWAAGRARAGDLAAMRFQIGDRGHVLHRPKGPVGQPGGAYCGTCRGAYSRRRPWRRCGHAPAGAHAAWRRHGPNGRGSAPSPRPTPDRRRAARRCCRTTLSSCYVLNRTVCVRLPLRRVKETGQSVGGAAQAAAAEHPGAAAAAAQSGHLGLDERGDRGQRVGDVVDEDLDVERITAVIVVMPFDPATGPGRLRHWH